MSKERKWPAHLRWGDISTSFLTNYANELRRFADSLDEVVEKADELEVTEFRSDGVTKPVQVRKLLSGFLRCTNQALESIKWKEESYE